MTITQQQVFRQFLKMLHRQLQATKVAEISPFFKDFFLRDQLIAIVRWLWTPDQLQDVDLTTLSKEELLESIGSDIYILGYYLEQWDIERKRQEELHPEQVWDTLVQMSSPNHYLTHKKIVDWDEYDIANYRSLQQKAGKIQKVYGIYQSSIRQEEVDEVTSPPNRFYDTEEQAQTAIEEEMLTLGIFKAKELAVRYVYKST